jgi:hypothetical protein
VWWLVVGWMSGGRWPSIYVDVYVKELGMWMLVRDGERKGYRLVWIGRGFRSCSPHSIRAGWNQSLVSKEAHRSP